MEPLRFTPILKSAIWGGNIIPKIKNVDSDRNDIGESWEISDIEGSRTVVCDGQHKGKTLHQLIEEYGAELLGTRVMHRYGTRFPLLLKIIDAHHDLSVQVHPDNETANRHGHPSGKAEMWYILGTLPQAKIYAGLNCKTDKEKLRRAINNDTVMDSVAHYESESGQVYYLAPGCIHAIGAGNLLVEIQQSSDITYRLYDYGRRDANGNLRQLHIEEGLDSIDFENKTKAKVDEFEVVNDHGDLRLSENQYFVATLIEIDGERELVNEQDSFMMVTAIEGEMTLESDGKVMKLGKGESLFLAACNRKSVLKGHGKVLTFTA